MRAFIAMQDSVGDINRRNEYASKPGLIERAGEILSICRQAADAAYDYERAQVHVGCRACQARPEAVRAAAGGLRQAHAKILKITRPPGGCGSPPARRGTSAASACRCWCCSASSGSCRRAPGPLGRRGGRRARTGTPTLRTAERRQRAVVGDAPERQDGGKARHRRDAAREERSAGADLGGRRLVLRRHAAHGVGDHAVDERAARRRARPCRCPRAKPSSSSVA